MKFGPVEGTPEEVRGFCEGSGINLSEYIQKPDQQLSKIWLILPAAVLVISFGLLTLWQTISGTGKNFIFLFGFASSVWLAVSVHIRFKSTWGAGAIVFAGLLIMLVALGVLSPIDLIEQYKKTTS